jgi:hypothetical protein
MREVSPEAATSCRLGVGEEGVPLGVPSGVLDVLGRDGLRERGVHFSFLSIEFTWIKGELRGAR